MSSFHNPRSAAFCGIILLLLGTASCKQPGSGRDTLPVLPHAAAGPVAHAIREAGAGLAHFPAEGKTPADFIPKGYGIALQATGLLEYDNLPDQVIVLDQEGAPAAARPCLVLLQQADGGYRLAGVSYKAIKPAETAEGYQVYDSEDISIKDHTLVFDMHSAGPEGNLSTAYRYEDTSLVLVSINTYNMGASSHTEVAYNLNNGQYEQTVTNTMVDSMPSETQTGKYVQSKARFEDADPHAIIRKVYSMAHVN